MTNNLFNCFVYFVRVRIKIYNRIKNRSNFLGKSDFFVKTFKIKPKKLMLFTCKIQQENPLRTGVLCATDNVPLIIVKPSET